MNLPKTMYPRLVRGFYSNIQSLDNDDDDFGLTNTIKGVTITLTPLSLSRILGVPNDGDEFYSTKPPNFPYYDAFQVGALMCKNGEANPKPTLDKLTMESRFLHLFVVNNVVPRAGHKDEVTYLDMYTLLIGRDLNLWYAIIKHMLSILKDNPQSCPTLWCLAYHNLHQLWSATH